MKKLLSLLCLIALSSMVFAQNNLEDVIYLKNGSIIRGTIIEQIPNTSIKIQTSDKNIFNFNLSEIEKFTKEEPVKKSQESQNIFKQTGFQNNTEFGILVGMGNINSYSLLGTTTPNDVTAYSLSTINGWLINPNVFVGIGIGIEKLPIDYFIDYCLPLFLDTRYFILKKKVTPFFYSDMGYSWGWNSGSSSSDWAGIMVSAGAGVSYRFIKSSSLSISVGYKLQQIKLEWRRGSDNPPYNQIITEDENSFSNFIVIKIGISF